MSDEQIERQELYCHNCGNYVQFPVDLSMDGEYVLNCPSCDHEHCRVVENGIITEKRWDQRNGPALQRFQISAAALTVTVSSTSNTSANGWQISGSWGTSTASTSVFTFVSGSA